MRNLRHAVASALGHESVAVVDISQILGHTSTSTTDRYLHSLLEGERLRNAMRKLDR